MERVTPSTTLAPAQPRRLFLRNGLAGLAALMAKPLLAACSSDETGPAGNGSGGTGGNGPVLRSNLAAIGPLGSADANGLRLPAGFTSRIVAQNGTPPVPGKEYPWHIFPDGGATYATGDGGWIYVSNSEMIMIDQVSGGVGALRFDASGEAVDAYPILTGSNTNCAGGKTQWNTWLSCEEVGRGQVFECDVTGAKPAEARPALGIFKHEAVALDPVNQHLYLSEDERDGRFYRFVPNAKNAQGFADLTSGRLEVAERAADGKVTWHELPDPGFTGAMPTRAQVAASTAYDGGEGLAYSAGVIFLSTKGDNKVWAYDIKAQTMSVLYDKALAPNPMLSGVDNLTVTCCGEVLVAEDGDDMQVVAILADGSLKPLLQVEGHDGSEITGPAFDPSGTRLYFSSQRGPANGTTFEVSGPFHLSS
jgi:uncharacterized protein